MLLSPVFTFCWVVCYQCPINRSMQDVFFMSQCGVCPAESNTQRSAVQIGSRFCVLVCFIYKKLGLKLVDEVGFTDFSDVGAGVRGGVGDEYCCYSILRSFYWAGVHNIVDIIQYPWNRCRYCVG